jgi:hypothetical protein
MLCKILTDREILKRPIDIIYVGIETKEGKRHLHGYFELKKPTDVDTFRHYAGLWGLTVEPAVESLERNVSYVQKGGKWLTSDKNGLRSKNKATLDLWKYFLKYPAYSIFDNEESQMASTITPLAIQTDLPYEQRDISKVFPSMPKLF